MRFGFLRHPWRVLGDGRRSVRKHCPPSVESIIAHKELDTEMTSVQHLLSFVTNQDGSMVTIHADLAGIEILIRELEALRDAIAGDDCPHTHLFSAEAAGKELSTSKLDNQPAEVNNACHVKIYGWNSEWAVRHGLRPSGTDDAQIEN